MKEIILIFSIFTFGFRIQEIMSLIYFILNIKKLKFSMKEILVIVLIILWSISILFINNNNYFKALQQFAVIIITYYSYKILFENNNIVKIVSIYLNIANIVVILGYIQFIVYFFFKINIFEFILGKTILNGNILAINSICGEPGMYSQLIIPAIIYIFEEECLKKKKFYFKAFYMLLSILLSNTAIAYFVIISYFFTKIILEKNIIKKSLILSFIIGLIIFIMRKSDMIYMKISQSIKFYEYLNVEKLKEANLSTFALLSNFKAYLNSGNYIFGNGFGSIEQTYYKYLPNIGYCAYGLNSTDGYSLFNRILSEFGIIGILIIIVIIIIEIKKSLKYKINYSISIAAFFGIFSYFIRGGSYYTQGTIFFILLLIYSNKSNMKGIENN